MNSVISFAICVPVMDVDTGPDDSFIDYGIEKTVTMFFNKIPDLGILKEKIGVKLKALFGEHSNILLQEIMDSNLSDEYNKHIKTNSLKDNIHFSYGLNKAKKNYYVVVTEEQIHVV